MAVMESDTIQPALFFAGGHFKAVAVAVAAQMRSPATKMSDYFHTRSSVITNILESSFCVHAAVAQQQQRLWWPWAPLALKGGSLMPCQHYQQQCHYKVWKQWTLRSQLSGRQCLRGFPYIDQQVGRQSNELQACIQLNETPPPYSLCATFLALWIKPKCMLFYVHVCLLCVLSEQGLVLIFCQILLCKDLI